MFSLFSAQGRRVLRRELCGPALHCRGRLAPPEGASLRTHTQAPLWEPAEKNLGWGPPHFWRGWVGPQKSWPLSERP